MDTLEPGALVDRLKRQYVEWVWEHALFPKMSFGDATIHVFEALGRADIVFKVRVESSVQGGCRTFLTFHEMQEVPWMDVTDDVDVVEALRVIIANDPEHDVKYHSSAGVGGIHQGRVVYEFTLSPGPVREAYDPESWALSYLAHIFSNPDEWDVHDHNHAVNILWTVAKKSSLPRAKQLGEHLEEMQVTGANPDVWRRVLKCLR